MFIPCPECKQSLKCQDQLYQSFNLLTAQCPGCKTYFTIFVSSSKIPYFMKHDTIFKLDEEFIKVNGVRLGLQTYSNYGYDIYCTYKAIINKDSIKRIKMLYNTKKEYRKLTNKPLTQQTTLSQQAMANLTKEDKQNGR